MNNIDYLNKRMQTAFETQQSMIVAFKLDRNGNLVERNSITLGDHLGHLSLPNILERGLVEEITDMTQRESDRNMMNEGEK